MKQSALLFLCVVLLFMCVGCSNRYSYSMWKDTVEAYGDAEYQVLGGTNTAECLYNAKYELTLLRILNRVKIDNNAYFIGKNISETFGEEDYTVVYVVLQIDSNRLKAYVDGTLDAPSAQYLQRICAVDGNELLSRFEDFDEEEQTIFHQLLSSS